ncbi:PaaI family thioesterase [Crocinitomix sp.]|nr:PaaI family thioesterase [Crocinitomix sp.]
MTHFEKLKKIYGQAPIHDFYKNITLEVFEKESIVTLPITPHFFHGFMSTHGSVYFKLLDDAAYFACQSVIEDFFIVTTNFNISLLRPITKGTITAKGKVDFISQQLFSATAELFDERGRLCGKGQGQFMKSKLPLPSVADN